MMKRLCVLFAVVAIAGCNRAEFNLPPGDAEAGRATFVLMQCNECHSVEGVEHTGSEFHDINVTLGGKTTRVKTYADLVTSIIHPNHKLSRGPTGNTVSEQGESMMRSYNETMTVDELINLVTFLESKYEIWVPDYYHYQMAP